MGILQDAIDLLMMIFRVRSILEAESPELPPSSVEIFVSLARMTCALFNTTKYTKFESNRVETNFRDAGTDCNRRDFLRLWIEKRVRLRTLMRGRRGRHGPIPTLDLKADGIEYTWIWQSILFSNPRDNTNGPYPTDANTSGPHSPRIPFPKDPIPQDSSPGVYLIISDATVSLLGHSLSPLRSILDGRSCAPARSGRSRFSYPFDKSDRLRSCSPFDRNGRLTFSLFFDGSCRSRLFSPSDGARSSNGLSWGGKCYLFLKVKVNLGGEKESLLLSSPVQRIENSKLCILWESIENSAPAA